MERNGKRGRGMVKGRQRKREGERGVEVEVRRLDSKWSLETKDVGRGLQLKCRMSLGLVV